MRRVFFNHETNVIEVTSELVHLTDGSPAGVIENKWDVNELKKIAVSISRNKSGVFEKKSLALIKILKGLTGMGLRETKEAIDPIHHNVKDYIEVEIYDIPEMTIDHIKEMILPTGYTVCLSGLTNAKNEAIAKIAEFMENRYNSYDSYIEEKAYWTVSDVRKLIKNATDKETVDTAFGIFERWKHFTAKKKGE